MSNLNKSIKQLMEGPTEYELEEQRRKHEAFIKQILSGDVEDNTAHYELRKLVSTSEWFAPTNEDGSFALEQAKKGDYTRVIWGIKETDGRRVVRKGAGGRLLPLFDRKPDTGRFTAMTGSYLARNVPPDIDGLLLHKSDKGEPEELDKEFFEFLPDYADSLELEHLLLAGEPIDTKVLRDRAWLTQLVRREHLHYSPILSGQVAVAYTHPDRGSMEDVSDPEISVTTMGGAQLFQQILDEDELDGLSINGIFEVANAEIAVTGFVLAPAFLERALNGEPAYFRVHSPTVRCRAEFDLWLETVNFPADREIVEAINNHGELTLRAVSKTPSSDWRPHEVGVGQRESYTVSTPEFVLKDEQFAGPGFGVGPSQILCPGKLSRHLLFGTLKQKDGTYTWTCGTPMVAGRKLEDTDMAAARRRLDIAVELQKLLPAGENRIPRRALLTAEGAYDLRTWPFLNSREWIERAIVESKLHMKPWIWAWERC